MDYQPRATTHHTTYQIDPSCKLPPPPVALQTKSAKRGPVREVFLPAWRANKENLCSMIRPEQQGAIDKSKLFHFTDTQDTGAWRERLEHEHAPGSYCMAHNKPTDLGYRILGGRTTHLDRTARPDTSRSTQRNTARSGCTASTNRSSSSSRPSSRSSSRASQKRRDPDDPIYGKIEQKLIQLEEKLLKERTERQRAQTELELIRTKVQAKSRN